MNAELTAIVNQKDGVGKFFSCIDIGIGLVKAGKKVLQVDSDPRSSMTIAFWHPQQDQMPMTATDFFVKIMEGAHKYENARIINIILQSLFAKKFDIALKYILQMIYD